MSRQRPPERGRRRGGWGGRATQLPRRHLQHKPRPPTTHAHPLHAPAGRHGSANFAPLPTRRPDGKPNPRSPKSARTASPAHLATAARRICKREDRLGHEARAAGHVGRRPRGEAPAPARQRLAELLLLHPHNILAHQALDKGRGIHGSGEDHRALPVASPRADRRICRVGSRRSGVLGRP